MTNNKFTGASTAIYDFTTSGDVISGNQIISCNDIGIYPESAKKLTVTKNKVTNCICGYYDQYVDGSDISDNDFSGNTQYGIYLGGGDTNNTFKGNTANGNGENGIWLDTPDGADVKPHAPNTFTQNTAKGNPNYDLYDATVGEGCGDTDGTCNTWDKNKAHVCYPSGICP